MSIIYLSSNEQRPQNFTNNFPAQINLGSNAEISLIGYAGNLKGERSTTEVEQITITRGLNDTFTVYRGDTTIGVNDKEVYYLPYNVTIPPRVYTPDELASTIQLELNYTEYLAQYDGGWTCKYDDVAQPGKMWIQSGKQRGSVNAGAPSSWVSYLSGKEQPGTAADDTLEPFVVGEQNQPSFVCLAPGYMGDCGLPVASVTAASGFEIEFTTVGAGYEQCQFTMGVIPLSSATRLKINQEVDMEIPGSIVNENDYIWDAGIPIDTNLDFALTTNGVGMNVGAFTLGLTIRIDGQIGIVTTDLTGENPKETTSITWTATNLGAAGVKKLGVSPRYNTVSNFPVFEYLADVGAGWVSLGTIAMNEASCNLYRTTTRMAYGVTVNPDYIDDGATPPAQVALDITAKTMHVNGGGPISAATEDLYIGFTPWNTENPSPTQDQLAQLGIVKQQDKSNGLGSVLGFLSIYQSVDKANTVAIGIVADDKLIDIIQEDELCPIIVTCPDLGARGYIGMAGGGGTISNFRSM